MGVCMLCVCTCPLQEHQYPKGFVLREKLQKVVYKAVLENSDYIVVFRTILVLFPLVPRPIV
jgi:hypothetical protein